MASSGSSVFNFGESAAAVANLDIDGNDSKQALSDRLLVLRYLFGFRGNTLTNGAIGTGATRNTAAAVEAYLASMSTQLDIHGNGSTQALADGLLVLRYLFGFRGNTLINGRDRDRSHTHDQRCDRGISGRVVTSSKPNVSLAETALSEDVCAVLPCGCRCWPSWVRYSAGRSATVRNWSERSPLALFPTIPHGPRAEIARPGRLPNGTVPLRYRSLYSPRSSKLIPQRAATQGRAHNGDRQPYPDAAGRVRSNHARTAVGFDRAGRDGNLSVGACRTAPLSFPWLTGNSGKTGNTPTRFRAPRPRRSTCVPGEHEQALVRVTALCGSPVNAAATVAVGCVPPTHHVHDIFSVSPDRQHGPTDGLRQRTRAAQLRLVPRELGDTCRSTRHHCGEHPLPAWCIVVRREGVDDPCRNVMRTVRHRGSS